MIGQSGNVCLSNYVFTGIPVTIYSTIELYDSVIVLGITPQNLRKIQVALSIDIKVPQAVIFDQGTEKIKKRRKNDWTGTQANFMRPLSNAPQGISFDYTTNRHKITVKCTVLGGGGGGNSTGYKKCKFC